MRVCIPCKDMRRNPVAGLLVVLLLSTERTYLYVSFFGTYGLQVDSRACAYKHEYQLYCLEGFFNAGQCGWLGPSLVWGLLTCTR